MFFPALFCDDNLMVSWGWSKDHDIARKFSKIPMRVSWPIRSVFHVPGSLRTIESRRLGELSCHNSWCIYVRGDEVVIAGSEDDFSRVERNTTSQRKGATRLQMVVTCLDETKKTQRTWKSTTACRDIRIPAIMILSANPIAKDSYI